jgi:hypothetical protein
MSLIWSISEKSCGFNFILIGPSVTCMEPKLICIKQAFFQDMLWDIFRMIRILSQGQEAYGTYILKEIGYQ